MWAFPMAANGTQTASLHGGYIRGRRLFESRGQGSLQDTVASSLVVRRIDLEDVASMAEKALQV